MLTEEITPVVMVLRTPLVEDACQKNGLNFIDMLFPFSLFDNIDVLVRTASDQAYRLQKFKLRLFYASDIQKTNPEVIVGLDKAVMAMKKSEVAEVTITPEYAFGSSESRQELALVPANSTVHYEIELVSSEKEKRLWDMSAEEKTLAANKLEGGRESLI